MNLHELRSFLNQTDAPGHRSWRTCRPGSRGVYEVFGIRTWGFRVWGFRVLEFRGLGLGFGFKGLNLS